MLLNIATKRIFVSRDVVFHEKVFTFTQACSPDFNDSPLQESHSPIPDIEHIHDTELITGDGEPNVVESIDDLIPKVPEVDDISHHATVDQPSQTDKKATTLVRLPPVNFPARKTSRCTKTHLDEGLYYYKQAKK